MGPSRNPLDSPPFKGGEAAQGVVSLINAGAAAPYERSRSAMPSSQTKHGARSFFSPQTQSREATLLTPARSALLIA
jgi:hypothetical protein